VKRLIFSTGVVVVLVTLTLALLLAIMQLDEANELLATSLPPVVAAHIDQSGVKHPVTAVLLNFRGYDTLLEVAVLLLALIAMVAIAPPAPHVALSRRDSVLPNITRLALPLMILTALHILVIGAVRPGGAFQSAAVLAAALVLLHLSRLERQRITFGPLWAIAATAGLILFASVALVLVVNGSLLHYPPQFAGALILLIESGLMISLALMLGGLFLFLSEMRREEDE
jgi:multisubunit Na+/H+ antiporter MnhB subunit